MFDSSVIVLNYNDSDMTKKFVDSILNWEEVQLHVIVVDNRSSDGSYEKLKQYFGRQYGGVSVDVVRTDRNGGYSYGNNWGSRYAIEKYNSDIIVISNPDIEIDELTYKKLLETFYDDRIAVAAPTMCEKNGSYMHCSYHIPTYKDDLKSCFDSSASSVIKRENLEYFDQKKTMILTQMVPGCFFAIRADDFVEIEMLDENVFLYCEERILGRKILSIGEKIVIRKDLFFVHAHGVTIKKNYSIEKSWLILLKSRFYYQKKYNEISVFKSICLKACMSIFLLNLRARLFLSAIKRGIVDKKI